jgi:hypothetical protein
MDERRARLLREALNTISAACPALVKECYWAGTSAIALEETSHRDSFDLDFHSQHPFVDTRPFLAELERAFVGKLAIVQAPDARGSGFSAVVDLGADRMTLQVFAAFEAVPDEDLVASSIPPLRRVSLQRYLADKVQCLVERIEARDLADIGAVLAIRPRLRYAFGKYVSEQDALILSERMLSWTDDAIRDDLAAHVDIQPSSAIAMRDDILAMLKKIERGDP